MTLRLRFLLFAALILFCLNDLDAQSDLLPPQIDPASYSSSMLHFRYIGPPGNRAISLAGIPGDPSTYYVGAASGGIWKTTDGGVHWKAIFDDQPVASIGALALAPSDPNIVWAGTGETFIRSHISMGWGIFRSVDAGKTWERRGLEKTGRIGRIIIDPRNPDVVLVAALGHSYGPQQERGVYRTTDGGLHWQRVLFVDENTGAADIVMDPNHPDILFASMWQIEIHTWGRVSGGRGSSLWKSVDGGATWKRVAGHGLPERPFGKAGLAMTKADSNRVYALIETGRGIPWNGQPTDPGTLWRSDDGGENWKLMNSNGNLLSRPAYYTRLAVEPDNPDEAYFLSIFVSSTRDGGKTLVRRTPDQSPGFDNHDMWIDPLNGKRMIIANDEGVSISINRGESWTRIRLPIAQLYHATTDNRVPYTVCGNMQDGPSTCGPSNSKIGLGELTGKAEIPRGLWYSVGGGESGWTTPDPVDPNLIWSTASGRGSVGGIVTLYDARTKEVRDVEVWPVSTNGHAARDVKYRFVWDFPITISPHDHKKVYVGSQYVHMTVNGGQSWELISPDLTLNDRTRQGPSGGITGDNIGVEYGDVVYSIAESPITAGLIWAGTNDGQVQITRNGGKTWTNVTRNIPGILPWGTINNIEPSQYDAGTAYITVNGHQEGNFDPWVYKTADYGQTWKLIVDGIPHSPLSYARCVREDPVRRGLLYLGTENGLYVSFNDGGHWQPLQSGLPPAPVSWLTIQKHFNDLVVSTYGRGFYILDDLSPLQQLTNQVGGEEAHLFAPPAAYRFRLTNGIREASDDPTAGHNPTYGASLSYWLKSVPEGDATITIADAAGKTLRTFPGSKVKGINRVYWDLRFDPMSAIVAPPPRPANGPAPPAGPEEGPLQGPVPEPTPARGSGPPPRVNILAPPGSYLVKLNVGGHEYSHKLTVLLDPGSAGHLREIELQTAMLKELAVDLKSSVTLTDGIQGIRRQLRAFHDQSKSGTDHQVFRASDLETAAALELKFSALEDKLRQQKPVAFYEWPVQLTAKFVYLAGHLQSSDREPTTQARAAYALLKNEMHLVQNEYDNLVTHDLAAFNDILRKQGLKEIASKE
ncbi:MAG TPA: sialidase [Candidatus Angelobacter sp.]